MTNQVRRIDSEQETLDILVPPFDSHSRRSTLLPATFNLVATIVGGGVLSLPLAFEKCGGIVPATFWMIVAALATDRSLAMICLSARISGASSYGEVARMAFGKPAEWLASGLLAVFLLFVVTAYLVLIRDIWTPLVVRLWGESLVLDKSTENVVLLCFVVLMLPFLVQNELHALRFNCYVGFVSISVLCAALCYQAWASFDEKAPSAAPLRTEPATSSKTRISDFLFAFPIIILAFMSHFNILSIQAALQRPSRKRMQGVVTGAVLASGLLMYLFGVGGYLCFRSKTEGNILINLMNQNDFVVLAGRVGCGVTILMAMPLMVLPCRRNILELLDCYMEWRSNPYSEGQQGDSVSAHHATERTLLIDPLHRRSDSLEERLSLVGHPAAHYGSTLAIVVVCYMAAVVAPGVAFVWSLCGSGMAFAIAFVLPGAYFLQIQRKYGCGDGRRAWSALAWVLVLIPTVAAVACTFQTISLLIDSKP